MKILSRISLVLGLMALAVPAFAQTEVSATKPAAKQVVSYTCTEYNALYAELPTDPAKGFEALAKSKPKQLENFLTANLFFVTQGFMSVPLPRPTVQQVGDGMEKFRLLCEKFPAVTYNVFKNDKGYAVVANLEKHDAKDIEKALITTSKLPEKLMFPFYLVSKQLKLAK